MTTLPLAAPSLPFDPEASIRAHVRASSIAAAALGALFVGAMTLVPIGGAVIATGQVGVESRVKRISHPTGGTVKQVFVSNGDHVEAGAPLLQLDDGVAGAQSELAALSVDQLLAQRARLEAERLGASAISFPASLRDGHEGAEAAMAEQRRMFAIRAGESRGLRAQLAARVTQLEQQIAGYQGQIAATRRQQALIGPERDSVRQLYAKGLVTLSRLNQLERGSVDLDGTVAALQAQIAQARGRISETREQLIQMAETRRADAGTQLDALNNALNDQQMRSVAARDVKARSLVVAPYAGVIDKLNVTAVGDVVRAAEPMLEIVPDRDRKIVEVALNPADIDRVHRGQRARIKFTGLNSAANVDVAGTVILIAPDRTTNQQTGQSFFSARVAIDPGVRTGTGAMRTGAPAEVFIETGSRSMISYLTKPLRDQFDRAFRDN